MTCGFACTIRYKTKCKCNREILLSPKQVNNEEKINLDIPKQRIRLDRYEAYPINVRLLLWLQTFGIGATAVRQLSAALGISNYVHSFGNFKKMEEELGRYEIMVSEELLSVHVKQEMSLSPIDLLNGLKMICGSSDGAWITQGSGKGYKSVLGHVPLVGSRTKKILALSVLSKLCRMCKANTKHDTSLCSLNHEGSSKGMEAMGAFKNLMHIFENHADSCYG